MAEAASADKERAPDTTPAAADDKAAGNAGPAAASTAPPAGVGDMALQKKGSEVGPVDDPMEKQADEVAQRIMRATEPAVPMPVPAPSAGGAPGAAAGKEDEQRVRRKADPSGAEGGELPDSVRDYLATSKGGGAPLPDATRTFFESKFDGVSFTDVRVHDDPGANEAARAIGAVAFTRGTDVYFAAGMYDPVSEGGRAILAHELTHVVQQGGAGKAPAPDATASPAGDGAVTPDTPDVVRRAPKKNAKAEEAAGPKSPKDDNKYGTVDTSVSPPTLHIKEFPMPAYKAKEAGNPVEVMKREPGKKRPTDQADIWDKAVAPEVESAVQQHVHDLTKHMKGTKTQGPVYYLEYATGSGKGRYYIGDIKSIAARVGRPFWDQNGHDSRFDVDHKKDLQFGGAHGMDNFWLLFFADNQALGQQFDTGIDDSIKKVLGEAEKRLDKKPPSVGTVRTSWKVTATSKAVAGKTPPHWERKDLKNPALTKPLKLVPSEEVAKFKGKPNAAAIYSRAMGGAFKKVDPANPKWSSARSFEVKALTAPQGGGGTLTVEFFKAHPSVEPGTSTLAIQKMPGVEYGGHLNVKDAGGKLIYKRLSPLSFEEVEFDPVKGLVGRATIPTKSLSILKNTEVGVRFDGPAVSAYALITSDGISLPGPLKMTGGALELAVGAEGFDATGSLDFEIDKVGKGKFTGTKGTSKALALSAELQVDTELFTKAEVRVHYKDGKWSGGGTLGVGEGKVKGIKSAEVSVDITEEKVHASGKFEASIKGLEKGTLDVDYTKDKGLEIAGQLTLGKLPGIEGGTIDAKVKQAGEGWSLSGGVTAKPSIPGVTGSVTGKYDDGAFLAQADLGYQKGMLKGQVKLGVTNQSVTGGVPAGPATDKLTTWGGGQVTIKIAPWLQGTVGLELDPQGRLTVKGEVALPNELTFFDEKKVEKNIFKIGIDIPIVGVAVMGQRIGIFATIKGGLDASAGFGPGKLRALSLAVTYSPENEAATQVHGKAEVYVPAHAGLTLFVNGGIGAGIPVVSAEAGVKISGGLGLEGAAQANVDVDWTPAKGLVIDAKGSIFVEPKFRFAIDAYVEVTADLWVKTIDLYSKKWNLAAFEYGSGLRFGVLFPVHYEEGKPFELSLDNMEFVYPSIDPGALLKGLIAQIA